MKTICVENAKFIYEVGELARIFLPRSEYKIEQATDGFPAKREMKGAPAEDCQAKNVQAEGCQAEGADTVFLPGLDKNDVKRRLYHILREETGYTPPWGTLTGVRPCKITDVLFEKYGLHSVVKQALEQEYLISAEKSGLLMEIHENQKEFQERPGRIGVYVGIPFCPTRCAYCSFPSNARDDRAVERYLTALFTEIEAVGKMIGQKNLAAETVYIGGGTPTALTEEELGGLLTHLKKWIDTARCIEFTVEAGRPDTITDGKLNVIKNHGAGRISINPQTMKQETLDIIGRHHTVQEVRKAMALAKQSGIPIVNMDMIAGLPGESAADFENSLRRIVAEEPQNITVHTLAIKKASRLKEEQPNTMPAAREVEKMVRMSREILKEAGYRPYYLYRQKDMAGNFENVGYALPGTESAYNIRIMAEKQTILAMGAGGISKFYFPEENRLERVANVSNCEIYVQRIDEMIRRKCDFFEKW